MSTETWRDIPGYAGRYEISSDGRIRTVGRTIVRSNGAPLTIHQRLRRLRRRRGGYACTLLRDGRRESITVGRLVAEVFGKPE
jgi:hypothetical protein